MNNEQPEVTPHDVRANFMQRRRDKIVAEIQANRRGEYKVPTWVLTAILVAILAAFGALIYFS
ncbi:hypothetical protein Rhe02_77050 [Rhizocola hellebori]|uniref:Uncharacterized protein n=1 Tax=Rhizocola hellebori TaxID=1392758 RepID=A0A8J3QHS6_9ACTN|nr:hypothetical protein [Rhizocola hellebori]GIH09638.1 hypothetical protein Rhe02_77050 [Rhizocola hellebori]